MLDIILGIVLLVAAVFLVIAILFQSSKSHRLSGTIAGGAETFFGKTKGNALDRVLGKVTAVVAIVFCVAVVVMYVAQEQEDISSLISGGTDTNQVTDTAEATDTTEPADTTEAAE